MAAGLELRQVSVARGGAVVPDQVSLLLGEGELLGVFGPSGAGKTTLFDVIAGALDPTDGVVLLGGADITELAPSVHCRLGLARARQHARPVRGLTVLEQVALGAAYGSGIRGQTRIDRAVDLLEWAGLLPAANEPAVSLGDLERRKLELVTALACGPSLLLLDAPTAGLAEPDAQELVSRIGDLHDGGLTIVWAEQVPTRMSSVATRLLGLDHGRLVGDGPPDEVLNESEAFQLVRRVDSRLTRVMR